MLSTTDIEKLSAIAEALRPGKELPEAAVIEAFGLIADRWNFSDERFCRSKKMLRSAMADWLEGLADRLAQHVVDGSAGNDSFLHQVLAEKSDHFAGSVGGNVPNVGTIGE